MNRLYRFHIPANSILCVGIALGLVLATWGPLPAVGGFLAGISGGVFLMALIHC